LEIESCASGGARIDFGILDHVDRFWTSDCNDALERQLIQRWTMQFFPPEFLGCHIGPSPGHQTHRTHSLTFRTTIALFGHAGIECDLAQYSREDLERIKCWIAYYKKNRHLLHSGTMVRAFHHSAFARFHYELIPCLFMKIGANGLRRRSCALIWSGR
jgi:alpha-galactosidase